MRNNYLVLPTRCGQASFRAAFIDPAFRALDNESMLRHPHRRIRVFVHAAASLVLIFALTGCGKKKQIAYTPPPPPSIEQPRDTWPTPHVDARNYPRNAKPLYV